MIRRSALSAPSRPPPPKLRRCTQTAIEIEAQAKGRLADEYDATQERGDVGKRGDFGGATSRREVTPTAADAGLTHKEIHEARIIRDAIAPSKLRPCGRDTAWP